MTTDYRKDALCLGLIFWVTLVIFAPLVLHPDTQITDDYDGLFIAWQHAQISAKILSLDLSHFFTGQIFYPYPLTLAFSDHFILNSLISLPLWVLTHSPIVLLAFQTVLAQVITLTMMYFLLHEVTNDRLTALTLSLVFGFSPLRLIFVGHIHTFALAGVILAMLSLVKLDQKPSQGWLVLFWTGFLIQALNNFLTAWFIIFVAGGLILGLPALRRHIRQLWRWGLLGGLVSGCLLVPIMIPYLQVSQIYHYTRPITDAINFSLSPDQLATIYWSPWLYLVVILGLIISLTNRKFKRLDLSILWLGAGAMVMSWGPALHWLGQTIKFHLGGQMLHVPLPYLFFYYLVPGFKGFRTPSRWMMLAALALTVWAAIKLSSLSRPWRRCLMIGLLLGLGLTLKPIPTVTVPAVDQYPAVYYWLKDQPGKVVIELPMFRWGSDIFAKNEVYRMLYQTYHGKTLVNGYSGFDPPEWENLVNRLQQDFPSTQTVQELKQMGVNYLIIHPDEYDRWRGPGTGTLITTKLKYLGYAPTYQDLQALVYRLDL